MDAPNPILITVINMVIVFAVLYVLGLLIKLSGQSNNEKAETGETGAISGGYHGGKNIDSSYNYVFNGLRLP